jgi:ribonucleoside-diphosphate reductase beta chain
MKTILRTDEPYNLSPMFYPWAYEAYKRSRKNFWNPEQIQMGQDIGHYRNLSIQEREMFLDVFAMLTTSDLVIQENIALKIYERCLPPEIRLFLGHQISDESLHSQSYQHCIEVLSLSDDDIYRRYLTKPAIGQKFEKAKKYAEYISSGDDFKLLLGLIFFYLGWEGIWFYHGFSPIFAMKRRNKMTGTSEQLEYIARDEVSHFEFGLELCKALINEIKIDKIPNYETSIRNVIWDILEGEATYAYACIPKLGYYGPDDHMAYARYLGNIRLSQINIRPIRFHESLPCYNSLPWLSELLQMKKEKNFFETHVSEYQSGAKLDFSEGDGFDEIDWLKQKI